MLNLIPVVECNDEDGNVTCYAVEVNHHLYGKYVWITLNRYGTYDIECKGVLELYTVKTCKTLTSAKRYVSTYIKCN